MNSHFLTNEKKEPIPPTKTLDLRKTFIKYQQHGQPVILMATGSTTKDEERLAKLWDAYESQERELEQAQKKIEGLGAQLTDKDRIIETLRKVVDDRDKELRDSQVKLAELETVRSKFEPKISELETLYAHEKERYSKLFAITEELEEELAISKKAIENRDRWFNSNLAYLKNITSILDERVKLIDTTAHTRDVTTAAVTENPTPAVESDKGPLTEDEAVAEFCKMGGMTENRAHSLYNAGFKSKSDLSKASVVELSKVEGISPTLARKIKTEAL